MLISEPNVYKGKVMGRAANTRVFPQNMDTKQRAVIIASRGIMGTEIAELSTKYCVTVLVTGNEGKLLLTSFYMDIKERVEKSKILEVIQYAEKKGLPLIMGWDTNAHSCLYGTDNNRRGDDIEDIILKYDLKIENVGITPTFQTFRGNKEMKSCIDVTLSKNLGNLLIRGWKVNTEYNASDHNAIEFQVDGIYNKEVTTRKWHKADWGVFKDELRRKKIYIYRIN